MTADADPSVTDWQLCMAAYNRNAERQPRRHWWRELVTDAWRCADHAWQLEAEAVAIGYTTELREFAAIKPRPKLGEFMRHLSIGPREEVSP